MALRNESYFTRGRIRGREAEIPWLPIRRSRVRPGNCSDEREDSFVEREEAAERVESSEFKEGLADAEIETSMEALLGEEEIWNSKPPSTA